MADPYCYASLSGLHEASGMTQIRSFLLPELIDLGIFNSVSYVGSKEEFLHTRRSLYKSDRQRYPRYFDHRIENSSLFEPSIVRGASTTVALESSIVDEASRLGYPDLGDLFSRGLRLRDNRAITYSLFSSMIPGLNDPVTEHRVRWVISVAYSRHQMNLESSAGIIPGIPGLRQFDSALISDSSLRMPTYRWFTELLRWADSELFEKLAHLDRSSWHTWLRFCLGTEGTLLRNSIESRISAHLPSLALNKSIEIRHLFALLEDSETKGNWKSRLLSFSEHSQIQGEKYGVNKPVILLHCVNENERQGILRACKDFKLGDPSINIMTRSSSEFLGECHGWKLLLLRSQAGRTGPLSAEAVVLDAIDELSPRYVVAIGVGFGLKHNLHQGDVMVATEVRDYERVRVGWTEGDKTVLRERGYTSNPDPILLGKLQTVASYSGIPVHLGSMICGEKLVDNPNFRNELIERFPDAIGGEMEASGVASACARRTIPWIVAKAISDKGDGSKKRSKKALESDSQKASAYNATVLLLNAINQGCFV